MGLHERINIRGHLQRRGLRYMCITTKTEAVFYAYRMTGRPARDLCKSPFLLSRNACDL